MMMMHVLELIDKSFPQRSRVIDLNYIIPRDSLDYIPHFATNLIFLIPGIAVNSTHKSLTHKQIYFEEQETTPQSVKIAPP